MRTAPPSSGCTPSASNIAEVVDLPSAGEVEVKTADGKSETIEGIGNPRLAELFPDEVGQLRADVELLWVKGSGGDLRTSTRDNFSSLYQSKLIGLQKLYAARKDNGLKSQAEDDMVGMQAHATFNLNPRASSIDTPL